MLVSNKILETTKFVVENSAFVKIDTVKLQKFSEQFEHSSVKHWLTAAPFDFSSLSDEEKLHYIFIFNSMSFSYWGEPKWTIEHSGKVYDGSWGMIVAINRARKAGFPILDFDFLSKITKEQFTTILSGNVEIPLFQERLDILKKIGHTMLEKYSGKANNLIKSANGDAMVLLDNILQSFPSFVDTSTYKQREIYFHKRAQLFVSDIFQIFSGTDYGDLKNADHLTACADYKLPQLLRKLEILSYDSRLSAKIDNKFEIPHGSEEEIEIRANTIWAVELIKNAINKRKPSILSIEINDHLWLATQEKFADDKPYHRTRTIAY